MSCGKLNIGITYKMNDENMICSVIITIKSDDEKIDLTKFVSETGTEASDGFGIMGESINNNNNKEIIFTIPIKVPISIEYLKDTQIPDKYINRISTVFLEAKKIINNVVASNTVNSEEKVKNEKDIKSGGNTFYLVRNKGRNSTKRIEKKNKKGGANKSFKGGIKSRGGKK